ncbi:MAG TPA: alpha/beta fold hydrolase [Polyangiaceae bacterium]|nr:alpha/beta fold hydrolase [Polyangiaceae bacterium]
MSDAIQLAPSEGLVAATAPWLDRTAYPFRSRFVQLSEGRVHYLDEGVAGSREPIVFVHGTPSWSFEFRHLIRELRCSRRCIALDHLGFGLSERPEGFGYRPEDHARVFAEFIAALGLERFTLVVHDFGGPIALPFAAAHPERIASLVISNSFMWPIDDPKLARQARFAGSALCRLLYRYLNFSLRVLMPLAYGDKRRLTARVHAQYLAPFAEPLARERVLWALARSLLASQAHYAALWGERARLSSIPSLVLWGTRDRILQGNPLERWQRALPRAEVVAFDDAGHWPHEERPELVLRALNTFWAQRDAEG